MAICPHCGTDNPEGANFCKTCRTVLPRSAAMKHCLNGHLMEADWNACPVCGAGRGEVSAAGPGLGEHPGEKGNVQPKPDGVAPKPDALGPAVKSRGRCPEKKRILVGFLVTYSPDPAGLFFEIRQGRYLIGSGKTCDLCLPNDKKMSSRHAVLVFNDGKFQLKDQKSKNGSFVNGEQISGEVELKNYDLIKMGSTVFQLIKVAPPKKNRH